MKSFLSFAALAVVVLAAQPSAAQTADATSGSSSSSSSGSSASSSSGSTSTSGTSQNQQRSRQSANQSTNTPITFNSTTPDRLTTSNSGSYQNNSSGYTTSDVIVRTTPTVYSPPVSAGNPCSLAYSAGLSVIGWGAAAGGTVVDEDCATRQRIAMIHNAGRPDVAFEMMCNDRATYNAAKLAGGKQCSYRSQFEAPGSTPTMVQQQPGPVVVTPAAPPPPQRTAGPPPRCNPRLGIVDNCFSG